MSPKTQINEGHDNKTVIRQHVYYLWKQLVNIMEMDYRQNIKWKNNIQRHLINYDSKQIEQGH